LAPRSGCRAEIHSPGDAFEYIELLIDLQQLEGGPRSEAPLFGTSIVRIALAVNLALEEFLFILGDSYLLAH